MRRGSIRRGINCQEGMNQYLQAVLLLDVTVDKPVRLSLLVAAYRAVPVYVMLPMPLPPSHLSRMHRILIKFVNTGQATRKGERNLTRQTEKWHLELEPLSCPCAAAPRLFCKPPCHSVVQTHLWLHERSKELGDLMVGSE
jgi:hypothetical protein